MLLIREEVGYTGEPEFDSSKRGGQPRRCLDSDRALAAFRFRAETDLRTGIRATVRW